MYTVKQVSDRTGISVRALHHYDRIGLLKPSAVTDAGYRLYDRSALQRLQTILLFRELRFPLRDIQKILDNPQFDSKQALASQIHLLELERKHIDALITFARTLQEEGVNTMGFDVFNKEEQEAYAKEVREQWGDTKAYAEYTQKSEQEDAQKNADALMEIFASFGALKHLSPTDSAVREKVTQLQQFITAHYYTCTKEMLQSLGEMYVADERFRQNIDAKGGEGTAAFVRAAIQSR